MLIFRVIKNGAKFRQIAPVNLKSEPYCNLGHMKTGDLCLAG